MIIATVYSKPRSIFYWRNFGPLAGMELSAENTPFLPVTRSSFQGPQTPLAGCRVLRRHLAGDIEQVAQRRKPLGGSALTIQGDLLVDSLIKFAAICKHCV
ncbi:MAG TPA: hypothetical protein VFC46_14505 [Humisphaera sp.]|nr:hypothetical protein [Humisphaera sp.]